MKRMMMTVFGLCAALPLCAQLQVNAPATTADLTNDQTLAIASGVTLAAGDTAVFSATLTMTLPSEPIDREEPVADKLIITADANGTPLVYAGGTWYEAQGLTVAEGDTLDVRVAARGGQDAVGYVVTLTKGEATSTVTTGGVAGDMTFSEVTLEGEGTATGLSVAAVTQGILPPTADGAQDSSLVAKYAAWLNDPAKGGAMPEGASEAAISDAFAMNVGGTPKLTVERVEPAGEDSLTFTVRASYVDAEGVEHDTDWDKINGLCYIVTAPALDGEVTVSEGFRPGEDAQFSELPRFEFATEDGARFAKAAVGFTPPEKKL